MSCRRRWWPVAGILVLRDELGRRKRLRAADSTGPEETDEEKLRAAGQPGQELEIPSATNGHGTGSRVRQVDQ